MEAIGEVIKGLLKGSESGSGSYLSGAESAVSEEEMAEQRAKYGLDYIDPRSSKELKRSEEELKRCGECRSYEECQYEGGGRGFKRYIGVQERQRGLKEVYIAVQECRYKKERRHLAQNRRLFESSGIPRQYEGRDLWSYEEIARSSDSKCEAYCDLLEMLEAGATPQLYVQGEVGSGKTELLSMYGNELIKRGQTVTYVTQSEVLTRLRYSNEEYQERLEELQRGDILIIEDVGGRVSEYNLEQLFLVIDRRQREGLGLIVSSHEAAEAVYSPSSEEQSRWYVKRLRERLSRLRRITL